MAAYGARLRVDDTAGLDLAPTLTRRFPPGTVCGASDGTPSGYYRLTRDEEGGEYRLAREGQEIERNRCARELVDRLCSHLELDLAVLAAGYTFIHAGVVGWRGTAILLPAVSGAGKSTLVAALVRRGADYYSDDWAVLDAIGRVHPFARPLRLAAGEPGLTGVSEPASELPPLPVALVVATTYRSACAWEPVVLQGARAVLPILDNAVLIREQPARILRLAAALAPNLITLESPRPEAAEVAAAILDVADSLHTGQRAHITSVHRPSVARGSIRAHPHRNAGPGGASLHRAPFVRVENLLTEDEHRRLLDYARAHEDDFQDSTVYRHDETRGLDHGVRRSRTLYALDDDLGRIFERHLRVLLPHVRRELRIPWFRVGTIERQIHVHRSGDFFGRHLDNGHGDVAARRVSAVYYFHETPRRFAGGALYLYDEIDCGGRRQVGPSCSALEPLDNSLVLFPSGVTHEVEPVRRRAGDPRASRYTITFWCREGERPQHPAARSLTGRNEPGS